MKRQKWIDVVKGIGIILVIIGHCDRPDVILKYIQSFHMPLFFITAGYVFSAKREFKDFAYRKASGLIKPYVFYGALNYIVWMIYLAVKEGVDAEYWQKALRYIVGLAYSRGTWYWMPNCSPIWFLTAMFCATMLFYIILKQRKPLQYALVAAGFCIACIICRIDIIKLPWNIDTAIWALLYMMIGYRLKQSDFAGLVIRRKALLTVAALFIFAAGSYAGLKNNIDYVSMDSMIMGKIPYMLTSTIAIPMAIMIIVIIFVPSNGVLEMYGRNTLIILGLNYMVNKAVYLIWDMLPGFMQDGYVWIMQCVVQIVILGVLAYASEKYKQSKHKELENVGSIDK